MRGQLYSVYGDRRKTKQQRLYGCNTNLEVCLYLVIAGTQLNNFIRDSCDMSNISDSRDFLPSGGYSGLPHTKENGRQYLSANMNFGVVNQWL